MFALSLFIAFSLMYLGCVLFFSSGLAFLWQFWLSGFGGMSFGFLIQGMSVGFSLTVLAISVAVCFFMSYYMTSNASFARFALVLFLFVVSMLFLVTSDSVLSLFLGWEGLGLTSYLLILHYMNWKSNQAATLTLLTNRLGDAILFIVVGYWLLSSFNNLGTSLLMALFLFCLAFTKSAQMPFVSWLPAAMAAPTPVSALVHSSTLVTAGIWLMLRYGGELSLFTSVLLFFVGGFTLIVASLTAVSDMDLKKVVAFSTLSQLGLLVTGLSTGYKWLVYFHMVGHAFSKASLFLLVGGVIHSAFSNQDLRWSFSSPFFGRVSQLGLGICLLSLSGLGFSVGAFTKELLLFELVRSKGLNLLAWLFLGAVIALTLVYCWRLWIVILAVRPASGLLQTTSSSLLLMTSWWGLVCLALFAGYWLTFSVVPLGVWWVSKLEGALLFLWLFLLVLERKVWFNLATFYWLTRLVSRFSASLISLLSSTKVLEASWLEHGLLAGARLLMVAQVLFSSKWSYSVVLILVCFFSFFL